MGAAWAAERGKVQAVQPLLADIVDATGRALGVPAVLVRNRQARIVRARQVVCYLARLVTCLSLPVIARRLGCRHSTVLHGARKIARLLQAGDDAAVRQVTRAGLALQATMQARLGKV